MRTFKLRYCCRLAGLLWIAGAGANQRAGAQEAAGADASPLISIGNADETATDDLGRTLPTFAQTGPPKSNRQVGMFFWQWHRNSRWLADYDVTEFLKTHPKFRDFEVAPVGKPAHPTWYWAQPIFGYYRSDDAYVIRKQLVMLADSGVDFLFLDYTNAQVYAKELEQLLSIARELKTAGVPVPRFTFFLNHEPEWKVYALYSDWYRPGKYDDLWFRWGGKPLLMTPPLSDGPKVRDGKNIALDAALAPEINRYFTFRPTWAYGKADKNPGMWRFTHGYEPPVALDAQGQPEQIVVAKSTGGPIHDAFAEGGVSAVKGKTRVDADYSDGWLLPDFEKGVFYQDHWDRARQIAPPITLITGWNEWTASVWNQTGVRFLGTKISGPHGYMVDEFNMQFNRDVEPMRQVAGGTFDNYYWQTVANLRLYKGMKAPQRVSDPRAIAIDGKFADWKGVTPLYLDAPNDTANRDHDATVPAIRYVNTSARNDIAAFQVARNAQNVAFHVQTAAQLSASTDKNWMQLFIDADNNPKTGWNGYDLLVNRARTGTRCRIERAVGTTWNWIQVATGSIAVQGKDLEIALPRTLFGAKPLNFSFKWADNLPDTPKIEDFYTDGDVAPNTRFNAMYRE